MEERQHISYLTISAEGHELPVRARQPLHCGRAASFAQGAPSGKCQEALPPSLRVKLIPRMELSARRCRSCAADSQEPGLQQDQRGRHRVRHPLDVRPRSDRCAPGEQGEKFDGASGSQQKWLQDVRRSAMSLVHVNFCGLVLTRNCTSQGYDEDTAWPHKESTVFLRPAFRKQLSAAKRDVSF